MRNDWIVLTPLEIAMSIAATVLSRWADSSAPAGIRFPCTASLSSIHAPQTH
jgi:hypothetical protein